MICSLCDKEFETSKFKARMQTKNIKGLEDNKNYYFCDDCFLTIIQRFL